MKIIFQLILMLHSISVSADIYKCIAISGEVFYQDSPCPRANKSETVQIKQFDPEKIAKAQQKLAQDLERQALKEQLLQEKMLKEREVSALERSANATESIAEANWYQSELSQQRYNYQPNGYFYFPLLKKPYHKKNKHDNLPAKPKLPVEPAKPAPRITASPRNILRK